MLSSQHAARLQDQSTIASLPISEATAILGSYPSDVNQTTDRPTELLPSHSLVSHFRWWEEAAAEIIRTKHDFDLITRTIKFVPIRNPTTAATLLSRRQKDWLGDFLKFLCRDGAIEEPPCDSPFSMAEAIVAIIRPRPSPYAPRLEQSKFISALLSSDIRTAAEDLDYQIHAIFCKTTFLDWTAWVCGCQCAIISDFLDAVFNLRNALAHSARQDTLVAQNLRLLQEANTFEALRFFLEPIAEQFNDPSISSLNTAEQLKEWCFSISSTSHKLSILDTRFRLKIVRKTDPKWPAHFSADFSLWESIQSQNPQDIAESSTKSVTTIFLDISTRDLLSEDGYLQDVATTWSDLADDFLACLSADRTLATYLMRLAENFIRLGNLFSAAAIGSALEKWGYRPRNPSRVWVIINPEDNFAGCRKFVADNPACLTPMYLYIRDLRLSGNAPEKILEYHQMIVGFLRRARGLDSGLSKKLEGKKLATGMTGYQYSPYQTTSSSFSWASQRIKGTAVHWSISPLCDSFRRTLPHTCFHFHPRVHQNPQVPLWHEQLTRGRSTSNFFKRLPKMNSLNPTPGSRKRSPTNEVDEQPPKRAEKKCAISDLGEEDAGHRFRLSRLQAIAAPRYTTCPDLKVIPEIKQIPIPLPEKYVREVACIALEELWTVEIQPEILVDSSITLSHAALGLLHDIPTELSYHDCLLLCCIKWEFNANRDVDQSWAFYYGQGSQDLAVPVGRYNAQTGDQMTIELASSRFAQMKEIAEARLREKYWYSMNVARMFLQLRVPLHNADRVDYLCNQVYNFCFACLKRPNYDLDCHLLRNWYDEKYGWFESVSYSILELKRMTANSENLVTLAHFQQAFKVATVAYCGLVLPAGRVDNQKLQSVLDYLQRLSQWIALRDLSAEEDIPPYLNDYIKILRRQLPCSVVPNNIGHSTDARLLSEGPDVESDEGEVDPALDYLKSLGNMFQQNQDRITKEEKKR
ncbi:hypothetical protein ACEPPN_018980 [Leptodophora sp. 'Broadleaf-Isolate-01']